jgi:hypothetical protein
MVSHVSTCLVYHFYMFLHVSGLYSFPSFSYSLVSLLLYLIIFLLHLSLLPHSFPQILLVFYLSISYSLGFYVAHTSFFICFISCSVSTIFFPLLSFSLHSYSKLTILSEFNEFEKRFCCLSVYFAFLFWICLPLCFNSFLHVSFFSFFSFPFSLKKNPQFFSENNGINEIYCLKSNSFVFGPFAFFA